MVIGYIYETKNLINGKTYIGQHKKDKFDIHYKGSGKLITQAISRYGKENFKTIVLEWCESREELNEREIYYIALYRAQNKAEYNIADGGLGTKGLVGEKNPFFGKKHTDQTKKLMSKIKKGIKGKDHPLYGRKMSPEHIAKTRRTGSTQSKETREKISNSLSKERTCHYCGKKLKNSVVLKQHIKHNHQKERKEKSIKALMKANSTIYKCPYCEREIKSKCNLTQHIRARHDKNYKRFE